MRRPPAILILRVPRKTRAPLALWLPLFLLWPLALVLAIIAIPIWLLVAAALWTCGRARGMFQVPWRLAVAIFSLPGLCVRVNRGDHKTMQIAFW